MASFTFNGSANVTVPNYDPAVDLVALALPVAQLATVAETQQGVVFTATSGATLLIAGATFAQLNAGGFSIQGGQVFIGDNTANTFVDGTTGNDLIIGAGAGDTLAGGLGADLIFGNQGNDTIAGAGSDRIFAGQGNDSVTFAGGAATASANPLIVGGLGTDIINVGATGAADAFGGNVTIFGGNGTADAADAADVINVFLGVDGTAEVYGNGGNDVIAVTGGSSTVFGGQGDDVITVTNTGLNVGDAVVVGGLGADDLTVTIDDGSATVFGGNGISDAADGDDEIEVVLTSGATGSVEIYGNGGNDEILVSGSTTGDILVHGGAGNDSITAATLSTDAQVFGGNGADTISVGVTSSADVTITGGNGVSDVGDGDDDIDVTLAAGSLIDGTSVVDPTTATIFGNGGNDTIVVSGAANTEAFVFGGQGNDVLTFDASDGADDAFGRVELTGGVGNDTFQFGTAAQSGTVTTTSVSAITDLNLNGADRVSFEGITVNATADVTTFTPAAGTGAGEATGFNAINSAASLSAAAEAAIDFAVAANLVAEGSNAAVAFSYQGEQYLTAGAEVAGTGTAGEADVIVQITGFTGTLDTTDFVTFVS